MRKIVGITCFVSGLCFLGFSMVCGCASPDVHAPARVRAELHVIGTLLDAYNAANGTYPSTQQGLGALVAKPSSSPVPSHWTSLLEEVPKDPWQTEYVYRHLGDASPKYDLFSAGPDHIADTADDVRSQ